MIRPASDCRAKERISLIKEETTVQRRAFEQGWRWRRVCRRRSRSWGASPKCGRNGLSRRSAKRRPRANQIHTWSYRPRRFPMPARLEPSWSNGRFPSEWTPKRRLRRLSVETCFAETKQPSKLSAKTNYFGGSNLHGCASPERMYVKLVASQLYAAQVIDLKP